MSKDVRFEFDLYDKVDTPLVKNGIITLLGFDDAGPTYYVTNNVQGVSERWWVECKLTKVV